MIHLTDQQIDALSGDYPEIQQALKHAFIDLARGQAAQQIRMRTEADSVKLSTLAAVIPGMGIAGAKVYSTVNGQFHFVIILFCAETGVPLATLDAGVLTKRRTAACSVLAAQRFAHPQSKTLTVFGLGVQGHEHILQFAQAYNLERIYVVSPQLDQTLLLGLQQQIGVEVMTAPAEQAVAQADIIVTATRAKTPVIEGKWLTPGTFIAAVGSSLPTTRELDDEVIRRTNQIIVEFNEQAFVEAGDLVLSEHLNPQDKTCSLAQALCQSKPYDDRHIVLYKAVGVALEDVALAGYVYKKSLSK